MGSTSSESNPLSPPRRNSDVLVSCWIKKDTSFRLNYSLLGNRLIHKVLTDDKQRQQVFCAPNLLKKFEIEALLDGQSFSDRDRSFRNNEDWRYIDDSASSRILLPSKQVEALGKNRSYVPALAQEHKSDSSKQADGNLGKQSISCYVSSSKQSLQPEYSNRNGTRGKDHSGFYVSGSTLSREPESSNEFGTSGMNDPCSILMKSNVPSSNADSGYPDFLGKNFHDSSVLSPPSSSERERLERKGTGTKRPPKVPKPKVHQCDFCPKMFALRSTRDIHHRSHTGERPFRCPGCPLAFTSNSSLKKHVQIHQLVLLKTCKTCGKKFRYNDSLKDHEKVHREWSGPHICGGCGIQFTRKVYLDRHLPNCMDH